MTLCCFRHEKDRALVLHSLFPTQDSLANYVNATSQSSISPSSSSPQATPHPNQIAQFASFWSDASSSRDAEHGRAELQWTTVIPEELIKAARELAKSK